MCRYPDESEKKFFLCFAWAHLTDFETENENLAIYEIHRYIYE